MNLTVAKKIIGGFSILSVLLISTSLISLNNLNNINDATLEQSTLAIPTLSGSYTLAHKLVEVGNLAINGYHQQNLTGLQGDLVTLKEKVTLFNNDLDTLKNTVSERVTLRENVAKIAPIFDSVGGNIKGVFSARKRSIEQQSMLVERIDTLEDKADDTVTLLLDLADNELADTTLQRTIALGEQIETQLDSVVASSFEYRDTKDLQTLGFIEKDISQTYQDIIRNINDVVADLSANKVRNIATQLTNARIELDGLILGRDGIFSLKKSQLAASTVATTKLSSVNKDITFANSILTTQVDLAKTTTQEASQQIQDTVSQGNTLTLILMVISLLLACVIAWLTLKSITLPLSRVNEMLNIVASGDLSRSLDEKGKDEFAELSKNCNSLIQSLRALINGIVSRSTQLATAAEETSAVTSQSTTAIEEQRNQLEQAASATTQMSSTAQCVLTSANDALGEIKQADDEAERVKTISTRNRQTIESLASEVDTASQVINKLQEDSASIGSILEVIRGIADQTNLLALNAAIEAARAGEQGRGFAVVADEVRTLASRTQESTQEIHNMIEALQTGAKKAVAVMEIGKTQAANCVSQSEEADKALETITHAVHEAFDRSSQIATAAEEQSVVSQEISENLESIVAIAEETSAGAKQTADASGEVAQLAEELQASVQQFKL
jgi:methyl-accepting chemotaxis protein